MFSRFFGKKKQEKEEPENVVVSANQNWAFLGTDMHSHFLPGIDDGAKTIEDSLQLIRAMIDMGYKSIITTPHIMIDYYPNTTETIGNALQQVKDALKENNIDIPIKAAAEYYIDEYFMQLIEKEPLLTIKDKEVLVEFSMLYEPPMLFDAIFRLQSMGYRPIIAHPERYLFFHQNFRKYRELQERGCRLQLNMLSIAGYYGRNIKAIADEMLAKNMYDYCGTDAHHDKHVNVLKVMTTTKDYHTFANYPFLNNQLCF
jgi:tyrosine-protein phosphatase YwqE